MNFAALLQTLGHVPRIVHIGIRHVFKLRNPLANIFTVGVKFLGLQKSVENENSTWASARREIPASIVGTHVMINQLFFEMVSSVAPIHSQILSEEARSDHSTPIWHKPCRVHMSLQSVNYWYTCSSVSPSLNPRFVGFPLVVFAIIDSISAEYLISVMHAPPSVEVTPEELVQIGCRWLVWSIFLLKISQFPVHFANRNRAYR